ncbi:MAG: succinate dehydrogenase, hydrophobic membrane anchor protein [Hyphomicrobiaceae bacterium]
MAETKAHGRQRPVSREGARHFRLQRMTAVILIPLTILLVAMVAVLTGEDQQTAATALGHIPVALLMGLLVIAGAAHMRIGMHEIIIDYFRGGLQTLLSLLNWAFFAFIVVASLWALARLSLGL